MIDYDDFHVAFVEKNNFRFYHYLEVFYLRIGPI